MARRKVSTTVYFTPEQDAALKTLSDRTKVPVAAYVREGIDAVLVKYRAVISDQHELPIAPPAPPPPRRAPAPPSPSPQRTLFDDARSGPDEPQEPRIDPRVQKIKDGIRRGRPPE